MGQSALLVVTTALLTALVLGAGAAAGPRATAGATAATAANLAPDPDFENDPASSYYTNGTAAFSWATDQSHSPTHSLKIVSTQAALTRWMSNTTAILATPGKTYYVTAWLRTSGVQRANLSVDFWNASTTYLGVTADSQALSGTNDWTRVSLQVTAPAGSRYLRIEFRLSGAGTLWADDPTVSDTPPPAAPSNVVPPSIGGVAQVGQVLTADDGSWSPTPQGFFEVWWLCDGAGQNCFDTPLDAAYVDNGDYLNAVYANGTFFNSGPPSVLLPPSAAGHRVKLTVFAYSAGVSGLVRADSSLTGPIAAAPGTLPSNTALPEITPPTDEDDLTFTVSTGTWSGSPTGYSYQWLECFSGSFACGAIAGATTATYTAPTDSDSVVLRVVVTARNGNGGTDVVTDQNGFFVPPTAVQLPSIGGSPQVGSTLTADPGLWHGIVSPTADGSSFAPSFRWLRCDATGASCFTIANATSDTYQATQQDAGHTLRVRVGLYALRDQTPVRALSPPTAVVS